MSPLTPPPLSLPAPRGSTRQNNAVAANDAAIPSPPLGLPRPGNIGITTVDDASALPPPPGIVRQGNIKAIDPAILALSSAPPPGLSRPANATGAANYATVLSPPPGLSRQVNNTAAVNYATVLSPPPGLSRQVNNTAAANYATVLSPPPGLGRQVNNAVVVSSSAAFSPPGLPHQSNTALAHDGRVPYAPLGPTRKGSSSAMPSNATTSFNYFAPTFLSTTRADRHTPHDGVGLASLSPPLPPPPQPLRPRVEPTSGDPRPCTTTSTPASPESDGTLEDAGQGWTAEQDTLLVDLRLEGVKWKQIGRRLGRTVGACQGRHNRLCHGGGTKVRKWNRDADQQLLKMKDDEGLSWDTIGKKLGRKATACEIRWQKCRRAARAASSLLPTASHSLDTGTTTVAGSSSTSAAGSGGASTSTVPLRPRHLQPVSRGNMRASPDEDDDDEDDDDDDGEEDYHPPPRKSQRTTRRNSKVSPNGNDSGHQSMSLRRSQRTYTGQSTATPETPSPFSPGFAINSSLADVTGRHATASMPLPSSPPGFATNQAMTNVNSQPSATATPPPPPPPPTFGDDESVSGPQTNQSRQDTTTTFTDSSPGAVSRYTSAALSSLGADFDTTATVSPPGTGLNTTTTAAHPLGSGFNTVNTATATPGAGSSNINTSLALSTTDPTRPWTVEEDVALVMAREKLGPGGTWQTVADKIPGRTVGACSTRYHTLRGTLTFDASSRTTTGGIGVKHKKWTEDEIKQMLLYRKKGWTQVQIGQKMDRTESSVKQLLARLKKQGKLPE